MKLTVAAILRRKRSLNSNFSTNVSSQHEKEETHVKIEVSQDSEKGHSLPLRWKIMLQAGGLKNKDIDSDMKTATEVAKFHEQGGLSTLFRKHSNLLRKKQLKKAMAQAASFKKADPSSFYKFGSKCEIGHGSFGTVYKCKRFTDDKLFALKVADIEDKNIAEREMRMHALSNGHENIIHFQEAFLFEDSIYLVVEYMDAGSLSDYIYNLPKRVLWKECAILYVLKSILQGLHHMHSQNHLHRDIKSENILVNSNGEVKIADFGFAVALTKKKRKRRTVLGSTYWMAPELLDRKGYDEAVDIWATGITAFEMAENEPPHSGQPQLRLMFLIKTSSSPELRKCGKRQWNPYFVRLVHHMVRKCPENRPSARAALLSEAFDEGHYVDSERFAKTINSLSELRKTELSAEEVGIAKEL